MSSIRGEGSLVKNFRGLEGCFGRVFRSANTDDLADHPLLFQTRKGGRFRRLIVSFSPTSDEWILEHVTLVVDLRSPAERDNSNAAKWASAFRVIDDGQLLTDLAPDQHERFIFRLTMTDKITHRPHQVPDNHGKMMTVSGFEQLVSFFNENGLTGLYKILLSLYSPILKCLKIITIHLEESPQHKVLIHCVQGKDRTGIIAMLVQCVAGLSDAAIIDDYARSHERAPIHGMFQAVRSSDRKINMAQRIKGIDISQHAPPSVMAESLDYLRTRYGSVPNYLDQIGFDRWWRKRLHAVLHGSMHSSRL